MPRIFQRLYNNTELIRHLGPWRGLDVVESATSEYVDWFNHRRLHRSIEMVAISRAKTADDSQPL